MAAAEPERARLLRSFSDGAGESLEGHHVTMAAEHGDPVAMSAFRMLGTWLGQAMANIASLLDPGRFVLGGGVSAAGELLRAPAAAAFREALSGSVHRQCADVLVATLGESAGVIGAADLARAS